ncbi:electron transport complex subunit D [Marinobacterium nitratireducens]|uniref:Electron transport complex subunit D n=1 Tax=Marinobacterium nitratireducens TaxID=518897 RepID=A0A917ZG55_9GAMM|nr:RnfABCDGE type electron transport complex subunit D [Marinobacterium nitratireducens]GGO81544.1 electron transport complex subunit D [Marinobacterium nitratireducens]
MRLVRSRRPDSVRGIMATISLALIPGTLLHAMQFGAIVWLQTGWCLLLALLTEALCLRLRNRPLLLGLGDLSWLVCGLLLARALPLLVPVWMMALAMLTALGLAKHSGGGLGRNRLNPAMAGLAVVAICFHQLLYPAPDPQFPWTAELTLEELLLLEWQLAARLEIDALSGATPLKTGLLDTAAPYLSWIGYLAGGLMLTLLRLIRIEIPLAMMASSVSLCMLAGHTLNESLHSLSLGGYLLTAFFIATDPVTSPDNRSARILFGITVGAVTELIREFGLYADGLCFAVLTANLLVPHFNRLGARFHRPWYQTA